MIANALATDNAEAGDLLTPKLLLWIGLFGVLPSIAVWRAKLTFPHWKVETIARLKQAGVALAVILVSGVAFSGHYAALLRVHREATSKMIPAYALLSAVRTAGHAMPAAAQAEHVVVGHRCRTPASDGHRELVIMVVGETVRADHWGLNGYARDTTPNLRKEKVLNFPDFWSCGTSTAISVPCMFSSLGHNKFDKSTATATDNALGHSGARRREHPLARQQFQLAWRRRPGALRRFPPCHQQTQRFAQDGECRDLGMLDGLQDYIDRQNGDILIVLHQMGNHGPAYHKRYPKEFERFHAGLRDKRSGLVHV